MEIQWGSYLKFIICEDKLAYSICKAVGGFKNPFAIIFCDWTLTNNLILKPIEWYFMNVAYSV